MNWNRDVSIIAAAAGAALLSGALFSGTATAITDTVFNYSTPQKGTLAIPASALHVDVDTAQYVNNGLILRPNSANTITTNAPIYLPNGATITGFAAWYKTTLSNGVTLALWRQRLSDGSLDAVVFKEPGSTNGVRGLANYAVTGPLQKVDTARFAYWINVSLSGDTNTWFYGARIAYTYTSAGD